MDRRSFVATTAAAAGAALTASVPLAADTKTSRSPFSMHFAPHFGMFRDLSGGDLVSQLEFMNDEGFTALEDNSMASRSREDQERVAKAMERLGMKMGVFVAHAPFGEVTFASNRGDALERIVKDMKNAVEVAKRVNAKWCTVVPGRFDDRVAPEYQAAYAVDNLKRAAEICEPSGLVMVLEPLNPRDHPGLFLTRIPQAYQICRAVGSPSCKILDDLYHQQITEGNLIPNLEAAWDEIAYFQVGDNPGRREPTTGEINFANVFRRIKDRGFTGLIGMEHGVAGPGAEGQKACIQAYRACDPG